MDEEDFEKILLLEPLARIGAVDGFMAAADSQDLGGKGPGTKGVKFYE